MDNHCDKPANLQQFLNEIKEKQKKIYLIARASVVKNCKPFLVAEGGVKFTGVLAWTLENGEENETEACALYSVLALHEHRKYTECCVLWRKPFEITTPHTFIQRCRSFSELKGWSAKYIVWKPTAEWGKFSLVFTRPLARVQTTKTSSKTCNCWLFFKKTMMLKWTPLTLKMKERNFVSRTLKMTQTTSNWIKRTQTTSNWIKRILNDKATWIVII